MKESVHDGQGFLARSAEVGVKEGFELVSTQGFAKGQRQTTAQSTSCSCLSSLVFLESPLVLEALSLEGI